MKSRSAVGFLSLLLLLVFCLAPAVRAADYPKQPITIKLEGAKMPPVTFSHDAHVEKQKIACVTCHHSDPKNPKACTTCHGSEAKNGAPPAKTAFHDKCQGCHKDMAAKGVKAPTKCAECHKK